MQIKILYNKYNIIKSYVQRNYKEQKGRDGEKCLNRYNLNIC